MTPYAEAELFVGGATESARAAFTAAGTADGVDAGAASVFAGAEGIAGRTTDHGVDRGKEGEEKDEGDKGLHCWRSLEELMGLRNLKPG